MSGSLEVGPYHDSIAMISTWQRSSGVTAAVGERRIRQFIESRQIALKDIKPRIEEEETQLVSYHNAIYNLEMAISDGRKMLKAHDDSISILKSLKQRISDISSSFLWEPKPEETSEVLCSELKVCLVKLTVDKCKPIQDQIDLATEELRELFDKVCQLEIELDIRKHSRRLSQLALDQLNSRKDMIEEDITYAEAAFSAMWRIPTDIWVMIFTCVRQEEMDDYLTKRDSKTLRPVVHVLSHVCYSWRRIVDAEPLLWTTVYVPPTGAWKYHEHDLLVSSARKSIRPLTLLVNVYQSLSSGHPYDPSQRFETDDSIALTLVPDETMIFHGEPYSLHLKMKTDHSTYMQRMSHVPFHQPSSLILQSEMDICKGLFRYVSYQAVKSLTIISPVATSLPAINIVDKIPQIINLNLSIPKLPANMTLAGYLPPALEELHIHHEARATFPSLQTRIPLPNLRTLGLTYGSTRLLEVASMPALRTLTLYGSSEHAGVHKTHQNDNSDQNYGRVMEVEFREWGVVDAGSTNSGAVSLLQKLVSKMTALHSIKFAHSFVAGQFLLTVVDDAKKRSGSVSLKALKEVTLNKVTGITRSQCDTLANLVPKLNIYV